MNVRFDDLIGIDRTPDNPTAAQREAIGEQRTRRVSDDTQNSGMVQALFGRHTSPEILRTSRRGFLKASGIATLAATFTSALTSFGPAKRVAAQTGIVGEYPRRIMQYCPPYNANDNCQPGCGSAPICADCCTPDGYFRNEPQNGYSLSPGGCGDGDIADGWLWRYNGICGNCSTIEYRCSDGYVQTASGPSPFICRYVTECVPLEEGQEANKDEVDLARQTNWKPAGAIELVSESNSFITIKGWVTDGVGKPLDIRVVANGNIVSVGKAQVARPDIANSVRGADLNCGFNITFTLIEGPFDICVDAIKGPVTARVGCVKLNVGDGETVRGSGRTGSITARPTATATATSEPAAGTTPEPTAPAGATPEPTVTGSTTPEPTVTSGAELDGVIEGAALVTAARLPQRTSNSRTDIAKLAGTIEVLHRVDNEKVFVSGWAGEHDSADPVYVEIKTQNTVLGTIETELPRHDVADALPKVALKTGFSASFAQPTDTRNVCISAISPTTGARKVLFCGDIADAIEPITPPTTPGDSTSSDSSGGDTSDAVTGFTISGESTNKNTIYAKIEDARVQGSGDSHSVVIKGWAYDPNDHKNLVTVTAATTAETVRAKADQPGSGQTKKRGVNNPVGFELVVNVASGQQQIRLNADSGSATIDLEPITVNVP